MNLVAIKQVQFVQNSKTKMKKYVLIGLLAAAAFTIFAFNWFSQRGPNMSNSLNVAFPKNVAARDYEPTKIHMAPEYIFLENTFSPLVELAPEDASIRSGVADKWEWQKDELHFFIRDGLKTVDGKPITAEDAAFSLKRLLVRTQNTHGNLKDLVCGGTEVKSMEDLCAGISYKGNELILKITGKSAFILPMLSGIDFAIIPKSSVDPKTLDIIDYRNTSGPYYVSRDSETGEIELTVNQNHYHYSDSIAEKIYLIPVDPKNKSGSIQLFEEGKVDLITTIDSARSEEVYELSRRDSKSQFHSTSNIRTFALFFTERGMKELSLRQRSSLGQKVKTAIGSYFLKLPGYENTDQFFPKHGDGAIDNKIAQDISSSINSSEDISNMNFSIGIIRVGKLDIYRKELFSVLPNSKIFEDATLPSFKKFENISDMPHAYIAGPDTGFNEDISLISYSLTAGFFGLNESERQAWLAEYMSKPNKSDRLLMLQSIHESALRQSLLTPLFSGPYTAIVRSGWKIHLSKILANNPLWLIKKN